LIEITTKPILPETIINRVKTNESGCAVCYIGLIRENSRNKKVSSVEYFDSDGKAKNRLEEIANEACLKWQLNGISFSHRIGKLEVGDINLVIAISSGHREEGFAACQYVIDRFKEKLPTDKRETYTDGSIYSEYQKW